MGISVPELEKMMLDANAVNLISLNKKWYETDSYKDVREIDILEDKKGEDPTRRIQKNDLMRLVTKGLNRNERLIIILYYYEELTMKEIGATLDLSESRVSQMHSASCSVCRANWAAAGRNSAPDLRRSIADQLSTCDGPVDDTADAAAARGRCNAWSHRHRWADSSAASANSDGPGFRESRLRRHLRFTSPGRVVFVHCSCGRRPHCSFAGGRLSAILKGRTGH